jgi:hypothetical protein
MGIARVQEALESNDWAQLDDDGALSDFGDFEDPDAKPDDEEEDGDDKDLDPENLDFGFDRADFEGLRRAIWSGGQGKGGDSTEETAEKERMNAGFSAAGTFATEKPQDKESSSNSRATKGDAESSASASASSEMDPTMLHHDVDADDDDDIAKVETMMRKLQAVREAGEGMGEAQRRRMAARAVEEVMREL